MKKDKTFFIFAFLVVFFPSNIFSQITIGSNLKANSGALLDLKENEATSSRGLLLPRVSLKNLSELTMGSNVIANGDSEWKKETGLIVYNINTIESKENRVCPGLHVWMGDTWVSVNPYNSIQERVVEKSLVRNYEYLVSDPSDSQFDVSLWPADKKQDAKDGKFMLGHTATNNTENLVDIRGDEENTYFVSRFYVGYKTEYTTYELQKSYRCDSAAEPVWVADHQYEQMNKIFDDGVWTTQNMRPTKFADGTNIPLGNASIKVDNVSYYVEPFESANLLTYGRFYNWAAVINMGTGVGQTPYSNVEQGGNNHDVKVQGICPNGWHVPSIQELTDMYNGVSLNAPLFSKEVNGGASNAFDYTIPISDSYKKGPVWNALRSSTMYGNSNLADQGGFYSLPASRPGFDASTLNSYSWTASSATVSAQSRAYGTYIVSNTGVMRERMDKASYNSVRCMRNTK